MALGASTPALADKPAPDEEDDPEPSPIHLRVRAPSQLRLFATEGPKVVDIDASTTTPSGSFQLSWRTLEKRRLLCEGDCSIRVPAGLMFQFEGPGTVPSRRFTLPADGDDFVVDVRPGASWLRTSAAFAVGGGVVSVAASLLLALRDRSPVASAEDAYLEPNKRAITIAVGVFGGLQIVAGIVGLAWSRTAVDITPSRVERAAVRFGPSGLQF